MYLGERTQDVTVTENSNPSLTAYSIQVSNEIMATAQCSLIITTDDIYSFNEVRLIEEKNMM
jgi:hypothetical protein